MFQNLGGLNSIETQITMGSLYEIKLGIHNHLATKGIRPLSTVAFLPAESTEEFNLLRDHIQSYLHKGIQESFGYTFSEYMALPASFKKTLIEELDTFRERTKPKLPDIDDN